MKKIPLTRKMVALVDDDDFVRVSRRKWHARRASNKKNWYASCVEYAPKSYLGAKRQTIQMANFILQPGLGYEVDHINGDGLDNRKSNLRVCTRAQNVRNVRAYGVSGIKGAYWQRGAWVSRIQAGDIQYYLGRHKTKEEAGAAYDRKARELYGAFARTNGLG